MPKKIKIDPSLTPVVEAFLARANAGIPIADLLPELHDLYEGRADEEMKAWILARDGVKKLVDEIGPVARMLEAAEITEGKVRFPQDSQYPDCWLLRDGQEPLGIEVTVSGAKERLALARERLSNPGQLTRGRIALTDDATDEEFAKAAASRRCSYSTAGAVAVLAKSIRLCLENKLDPKYAGMYLVIDANLLPMAPERWMQSMPDLTPDAAKTAFERVYVVGRNERSGWLRLR